MSDRCLERLHGPSLANFGVAGLLALVSLGTSPLLSAAVLAVPPSLLSMSCHQNVRGCTADAGWHSADNGSRGAVTASMGKVSGQVLSFAFLCMLFLSRGQTSVNLAKHDLILLSSTVGSRQEFAMQVIDCMLGRRSRCRAAVVWMGLDFCAESPAETASVLKGQLSPNRSHLLRLR